MATVQLYLNRRLKPILEDKTEKYPLYISVFAFQQRSQFKVRNTLSEGGIYKVSNYYSESQFNNLLKAKEASYFKKYISRQEKVINTILNELFILSKDKISLKNFSKVYDLFSRSFIYDLDKMNKERLQDFLKDKKFDELLKIVNWDLAFAFIYDGLRKFINPDSSYMPIFREFKPLLSEDSLEFFTRLSEHYMKEMSFHAFQSSLSYFDLIYGIDENYILDFFDSSGCYDNESPDNLPNELLNIIEIQRSSLLAKSLSLTQIKNDD